MVVSRLVVFLSLFYTSSCFSMGSEDNVFTSWKFSSSSSSEEVRPEIANGQEIKLPFKGSMADGIHVVAFNVEQGNFMILRNGDSIVLFDAGSSNFPWENFTHSSISSGLNDIFEGTQLKGIVISHLDNDHHSYLSELLEWAKIKGCINTEVSLFVGGDNPQAIKKLADAIKDKCSAKLFRCISSRDSYQISESTDNEFSQFSNVNKGSFETELKNCCGIDIHLLEPFCGVGKDISRNSQSLMLCCSLNSGSILFSGDATEATLGAIGYNIQSRLQI